MYVGKARKSFFLFFVSFIFYFLHSPSALASGNNHSDFNLQGQIPRLEFDARKYDFGKVYRGQKLTHIFYFKNKGNGTLVLGSIHVPCGCINTKIYDETGENVKSIFLPNETGMVSVNFDTRDFSGTISRNIIIETNIGSSSPTMTLTVSANIVQEIEAQPSIVYLGKLEKNSQKNFTIKLNLFKRGEESQNSLFSDQQAYFKSLLDKSNLSEQIKNKILSNKDQIKVFSVESESPFLHVRLSEQPSSDQLSIIGEVDDRLLPVGPISSQITVWNNSTYYKNFSIPIIGDVISQLDISEKYIEFGVVTRDNPVQKSILFKSMDKNFQITGVRVELKKLLGLNELKTSDLFQLKVDKLPYSMEKSNPDDYSSLYQLNFRLIYPEKSIQLTSDNFFSGINISGFFIVKTNDPDYKEVSVPFFGVLRKTR